MAKEDIIYNIHLGRFKTPFTIIDDRMLRLPLFEAMEETIKYIKFQIKYAFEITEKTVQRTEIPEYPLDAIREMVLNAVIHRDYLSSADVQIKLFDNYITFFNPGGLHHDLTVEDLKTDYYPAYARNKLLAEAFYLTGDIEKYGSGFFRIRNALAEYPTMTVDFKEISGGFMVTVGYEKQKTSMDVTENVTENVIENREIKILELIIKNNNISTTQIAKELSIARMTVHRDIEKLKAKGLLERVGAAKGGYWNITDK